MDLDRRLFPVAALGGLIVLLAGCSGAPSPEESPDSPLTSYMNALYGGDLSEEEQQKQFEERNRESEDLVAACMTEQGFEYTPNVVTGSVMTSSGQEWDPDNRDWVSQYGYGIINYPGHDEPVEPEQSSPDPNAAYVESLSTSEQTAFYEALYGPQPSEEDVQAMNDEAGDGSGYEYDWTTAGCSGAAQHETAAADPLQGEEFKTLSDSLNAFWTDMGTGPEFTAVDTDWAACMDEAGQPGFATQSDASNSINEKYNAFWENASGTEGVSPDSPEVEELGEQEIALALVDLDCREKINFNDRRQEAQFAAEEKFVADHKSELDALKAAAEQARS